MAVISSRSGAAILPPPSLLDFLDRDSQFVQRRQEERLAAERKILEAETQEMSIQTTFYHPTPPEFLDGVPPPDPEPAPNFMGRSDQLLEKRRDFERQREAAEEAQARADAEATVLWRWYRETPSTSPRVPLIGPAKSCPGFPSFLEREGISTAPPRPPPELIVLPPGPSLEDFFIRDEETKARRRCDGYTEPDLQVVFTTPRSQEILDSHRDRESVRTVPMTVYTYRPDMSLTAASAEPLGLPLSLVEAQMVMRDIRRFGAAAEQENLGRPIIIDRQRMVELAEKSKTREKSRRAASMPVERADDVDFQAIGERERKERRRREEARKKRTIAFGFKREIVKD
jgi:hypothetical protein